MSSENAGATTAQKGASLGGEAFLIFAARVLAAASTSIITIVLASQLGSQQYGVYAVGMTVATMAATFAELGIASAIARFVADAHPERPAQRAIVALGLRVKAAAALIVALIMVAAAEPIAELFGGYPGQADVIRAAALAVLFSDLFASLGLLFVAFRTARANILLNGAKSLVELVLVVILVVVLARGPLGAMIANALGYGVGAAIGLLVLGRSLSAARGGTSTLRIGELLRSARLIWFTSVAWIGFVTIDLLLLGIYLGPEAVGLYDAPFRINTIFQFIGLSVATVLAPRMVGGGDPSGRSALFTRTFRALIALYITMVLALIPLADEIVAVTLGDSFAKSADILLVLLPYICMMGATPLMSLSLNYIGTTTPQVVIGFVALGIDALLDVILIPRIGVIGPAISTDIAFAFYFAGHLYLCRRIIGIDMSAVARSAGAGLAAGGVALLAGAGVDSLGLSDLATLALGTSAAAIAGLGCLAVLRQADGTLRAALRHRE